MSGATAAAAGTRHSLVLLEDQTGWAWGDNEYGQLGNGWSYAIPVPKPIALP